MKGGAGQGGQDENLGVTLIQIPNPLDHLASTHCICSSNGNPNLPNIWDTYLASKSPHQKIPTPQYDPNPNQAAKKPKGGKSNALESDEEDHNGGGGRTRPAAQGPKEVEVQG